MPTLGPGTLFVKWGEALFRLPELGVLPEDIGHAVDGDDEPGHALAAKPDERRYRSLRADQGADDGSPTAAIGLPPVRGMVSFPWDFRMCEMIITYCKQDCCKLFQGAGYVALAGSGNVIGLLPLT